MRQKTIGLISGIALLFAAELSAAEPTPVERGSLARQSLQVQQPAGQAEKLMREGNQLYLDDRYLDAVQKYLEAKALFERYRTPEFEYRAGVCAEQIRKCYFQLAEKEFAAAEKSMQSKDFDAASKALKEAIKLYPEAEDRAKAKIAELERRKAAALMREKTGEEALLPDRELQAYRIQVLLRQGQELSRAGRYQDAAQKFSSVLMIDPYNAAALHDLKSVNNLSRKVAYTRYQVEHRKLVTETEWRWAVPGVAEVKDASEQTAKVIEKDVDVRSELEKKLRSIILDNFRVDRSSVPAVVRALQEASRIADPQGGGVNIFLRRPNAQNAASPENPDAAGGPDAAPAPAPAPGPAPAPAAAQNNEGEEEGDEGDEGEAKESSGVLVNMNIRKRSLEDALRLLCREAKLRMRIDSHAVVLAPENVALGDMETKIFPVEKSVFMDTNPDDKSALMSFFKDRGIPFPQNSKIVYVTLLSRLVVTNTADNLNRIQELLEQLQADREPLVEITAKFLEVSQDNLKELGFSYNVSFNSGNADPDRLSFSNLGNNQLRSYGTDQPTVTVVGNSGGDDGLNYIVSMNALNQLKSSDFLASPRIITMSGMAAHIEMVRKEPFVDEYEAGETVTNSSNSSSTTGGNTVQTYTYKGAMPSFQDPTDLGVLMDVEPKVNKRQRKITLQVKPKIRTQVAWQFYENKAMDGKIEYMKKPILAEREIDTTVTVNDGKTIVLGGVIGDETTVQLDKIPILGDLPLVGRFFQSRYTSATKTNLLIFITCRLINPDGTPYMPTEGESQNNGLPHAGRLN